MMKDHWIDWLLAHPVLLLTFMAVSMALVIWGGIRIGKSEQKTMDGK